MKIIICGASGYLSRVLAPFLTEHGHELVLISRSLPHYSIPVNAKYVRWDGEALGEWSENFEGSDAVINLAGRSINCRFNEENRKQILESRIKTTRLVAEAIRSAKLPPRIWLNASGTSIYKNDVDRDMDEFTGEIGKGFLVEVGQAWEAAFLEAHLPNTRRVATRFSVVTGPESPIFNILSRLTKLFLGGQQGNGKQYVTWIHERDCLRAIHFLLENDLSGPVNVCAPHPLTNREFQKIVRESLGVKIGLPAPKIALQIGAILMQTEAELILSSRRVVPKRLLDAGFQFEFPTWKTACEDIVQHTASNSNLNK